MDRGESQPLRRPVPAVIPKPLPHLRSRWYAGVSTFGPRGRMVATGVVLGLPLLVLTWAVLTTGVVGLMILGPFIVLWCTTGARMALKDIWAKDTFYVPVPVIPPPQQMTTFDGHRIPTLEEHVASQGTGRTEP